MRGVRRDCYERGVADQVVAKTTINDEGQDDRDFEQNTHCRILQQAVTSSGVPRWEVFLEEAEAVLSSQAKVDARHTRYAWCLAASVVIGLVYHPEEHNTFLRTIGSPEAQPFITPSTCSGDFQTVPAVLGKFSSPRSRHGSHSS
jgi:hypothetical protein